MTFIEIEGVSVNVKTICAIGKVCNYTDAYSFTVYLTTKSISSVGVQRESRLATETERETLLVRLKRLGCVFN